MTFDNSLCLCAGFSKSLSHRRFSFILKLNKEFYIINRETGIGVWRDKPQEHEIQMDSKEISFENMLQLSLPIVSSTEALLKK